MENLFNKLENYIDAGVYPFHMPGHKRRALDFPNPYSIDITEIDGFDNLHHAEEILKEAQERAASLYGSKRCFYLVNGSTCGILAAICAATQKGGKILAARNSHKAVYHGIFLQELEADYLYPNITKSGIQGQITKEQVEEALEKDSTYQAILITSPTYEGIVSDISGISEVAHSYGIPVIVDAAHGAHLGFEKNEDGSKNGPKNPVSEGADVVIMSLHKTLPSFTQTALLHVCSNRISEAAIERYLGIFETSSPSYLFMAGMDACICFLQEKGEDAFRDYRKLLDDFYRNVADLKNLHVMTKADLLPEEAYDLDDSKLVIFSEKAGMTGEELHQILLHRYQLQMELVSGFYVLGMTSIMDTADGFRRLSDALHEIDRDAEINDKINENNEVENTEISSEKRDGGTDCGAFIRSAYVEQERTLSMHQAMALDAAEVSFEEAVGKVSADTIFLYPPGIPMLLPGEVISPEMLEKIRECFAMGLEVCGASKLRENRIKIVYF